MKPFHVTLHACGKTAAVVGECYNNDGRSFPTLSANISRQADAFTLSFEEAAQRLQTCPRMFFEPDGSFVWRGESPALGCWQLDGVLFDRADRLQFVELKGCCPEQSFQQLCDLLRPSNDTSLGIAIQLMGPAVFLTETDFRSLAFGRL